MRLLGMFLGIALFESDDVPIGPIYPSGKKDGNKLGKRKRNMEHSGIVHIFGYNRSRTIIHPSKVNEYMSYFKESANSCEKEHF